MTVVGDPAKGRCQQTGVAKVEAIPVKRPEAGPPCPDVRSRVLKAGPQFSIMTHHKIQSLTDLAATCMALQNQLRP